MSAFYVGVVQASPLCVVADPKAVSGQELLIAVDHAYRSYHKSKSLQSFCQLSSAQLKEYLKKHKKHKEGLPFYWIVSSLPKDQASLLKLLGASKGVLLYVGTKTLPKAYKKVKVLYFNSDQLRFLSRWLQKVSKRPKSDFVVLAPKSFDRSFFRHKETVFLTYNEQQANFYGVLPQMIQVVSDISHRDGHQKLSALFVGTTKHMQDLGFAFKRHQLLTTINWYGFALDDKWRSAPKQGDFLDFAQKGDWRMVTEKRTTVSPQYRRLQSRLRKIPASKRTKAALFAHDAALFALKNASTTEFKVVKGVTGELRFDDSGHRQAVASQLYGLSHSGNWIKKGTK